VSTRGHDCRRFFLGLSASLNALHFEPCTANRTICALAAQLLAFTVSLRRIAHSFKRRQKMASKSRGTIGIAAALSLATVLSIKAQDPATPSVPVKSSYQFPVAEEEFSSFFL
jgi:hypothetical protein